MSKVSITGKVVNGQQPFTSSNGSFSKQTLIVEVVNGNYTSYMPVDFVNQDIQNFINSGQVQAGGSYTFECYVQGSNQQFTDKNGQPTAYLNMKVVSVTPAQAAGLPPTSPQTAPNAFQQPQQQQGGFVGQPAQQPQGFGAPQQQAPQQGFGQQEAPAPNFGGGQANAAPAQGGGFAAPAQGANPFGAPQQ